MDLAKAEALYDASVEIGKQLDALTRLHDSMHAVVSRLHDDVLEKYENAPRHLVAVDRDTAS